MSYKELYVRTDGNDLYGGDDNSSSVTYTCTSSTVSGGAYEGWIHDDTGSNEWAGCDVGDCICFDTTGGKTRHRITSIDDEWISVSPALGAGQLDLNNKTTNVGGALRTPEAGVAAADALQDAFDNGTPPRVNIQGNHTLTACITLTKSWTVTKPLVVQGYGSAPGDRPGTQPVITVPSGTDISAVDMVAYNYVIWSDLHLKKEHNSSTVLFNANNQYFAMVRCKLEASVGTGTLLYYPGNYSQIVDTTLKNSGTATGLGAYFSANAVWTGCTLVNAHIDRPYLPMILCRLLGSCMTNVRGAGGAIGCLVEPPSGQNAFSADDSSLMFPILLNTIVQGVPSGKYVWQGNAANESVLIQLYNCLYNNDGTWGSNVANTFDGQGNVTSDPDLDDNDRPQAGSPVLGTGYPPYIDIGWGQKQESGGGGGVIGGPNKRGNKQ